MRTISRQSTLPRRLECQSRWSTRRSLRGAIPGGGELNLKALAAASGNKKVEMVHLKEVFALTGYVRGGCSPLGAKKEYPVYLDASAEAQETIAVSAGKRGEQLLLAPADLARAAKATIASVAR